MKSTPRTTAAKKHYGFLSDFLKIYIPLLAFSLLIALKLLSLEHEHRENTLISQENLNIVQSSEIIKHTYFEAFADIGMLGNLPFLRNFLANDLPSDKASLSKHFIAFLENYRHYDHVRVLDGDGREKLRVNYQRNKATAVDEAQLQNKSNRSYFTATRQLKPHQRYISEIEANIENGEIEIPFKPVIRFAVPVFDETDNFSGIVITNYLANELLKKIGTLLQFNEYGSGYVLNQQGYELTLADWKNQIKNHNSNFARNHPQAWLSIQSSNRGIVKNDQGVYLYQRVMPLSKIIDLPAAHISNAQPLDTDKQHELILVRHISQKNYNSLTHVHPGYLLFWGLAFFIGLFVITWLYLKNAHNHKKLEDLKEKHTRELQQQVDLKTSELETSKEWAEQMNNTLIRNQHELSKAQKMAKLGSWRLDHSTMDVTWSDEVFRIFEINPLEFKPSYSSFLEVIHPDDVKTVDTAFKQAIENKSLYKIEHRLKMPDGRVKFVIEQCETEYAPLSDQPLVSYGTVLDITEAKKTEMDLIGLSRKAEVANTEKSRFLANMSHELRTPMHSIMSFSSLALKKIDNIEKVESFLRNIHTSALRLTNMLNDLLDISKLEAGKMVAEFSECDTEKLVKSAVTEVNSLVIQKNITIQLDAADDVDCMMDHNLVIQVIINLLSNAIKFSPAGGVIDIRISRQNGLLNNKQQHAIEIAVIDAGNGIPADELESVFDKFIQSSKNKASDGGTGLGLPISKEIVELHHGQIWAESPPADRNIGSAFYIRLPILQGLPDTISFNSINDAIASHKKWLKLIDEMISTKQVPVNIPNSAVSNANLCSLGKWINRSEIDSENFRQLSASHKEFHEIAGECLAYCEVDNYRIAEEKHQQLHLVSAQIVDILESWRVIEWDDRFQTGIQKVDSQHRQIFNMINVLSNLMVTGEEPGQIMRKLHDLRDLSDNLFNYEELVLEANNYNNLDQHRRLHQTGLKQLDHLLKQAEDGGNAPLSETIEFLVDWWINHVIKEDMKYKRFFEKTGILVIP